LHLVGILFPHINDDARSKSHQICIYCVRTAVHTFRGTGRAGNCSLYNGVYYLFILDMVHALGHPPGA